MKTYGYVSCDKRQVEIFEGGQRGKGCRLWAQRFDGNELNRSDDLKLEAARSAAKQYRITLVNPEELYQLWLDAEDYDKAIKGGSLAGPPVELVKKAMAYDVESLLALYNWR